MQHDATSCGCASAAHVLKLSLRGGARPAAGRRLAGPGPSCRYRRRAPPHPMWTHTCAYDDASTRSAPISRGLYEMLCAFHSSDASNDPCCTQYGMMRPSARENAACAGGMQNSKTASPFSQVMDCGCRRGGIFRN